MIPNAQSPRQNENFGHTTKNAPKNSNKTFPAGHHFTRKLELVPDTLWQTVVREKHRMFFFLLSSLLKFMAKSILIRVYHTPN